MRISVQFSLQFLGQIFWCQTTLHLEKTALLLLGWQLILTLFFFCGSSCLPKHVFLQNCHCTPVTLFAVLMRPAIPRKNCTETHTHKKKIVEEVCNFPLASLSLILSLLFRRNKKVKNFWKQLFISEQLIFVLLLQNLKVWRFFFFFFFCLVKDVINTSMIT